LKKDLQESKKSTKNLKPSACRVISQYTVLGPHDFATIADAPDNKIISKVAIELGSRAIVNIINMVALPIEEFIVSMKKRLGLHSLKPQADTSSVNPSHGDLANSEIKGVEHIERIFAKISIV